MKAIAAGFRVAKATKAAPQEAGATGTVLLPRTDSARAGLGATVAWRGSGVGFGFGFARGGGGGAGERTGAAGQQGAEKEYAQGKASPGEAGSTGTRTRAGRRGGGCGSGKLPRGSAVHGDGTAAFVSIGGWGGQGDAGTADGILGQLQAGLGYALALGLGECTGEEGGLLLHNRAKRKLSWDFEAAWAGAGWVVPGVCT